MKDLLLSKPLFLIISILLISLSLSAQFAGGSGTVDDPYLIGTAEHLNNIRNFLTAHFEQTADIDLDIPPYNEGLGWEPVSTFSGSYNGNGNIIENLYVNRPASSSIGLFGITDGAVLNDIALVNVSVIGGSTTGGLVGELFGASSITNCYLTGEITGAGNTGGLVGNARYNSVIENSYTNATVAGEFPTGGIVGVAGHFNDYGDISGCFVMGHTTTVEMTNSFVGGIVGSLWNSTLSDSYNVGPVTGQYAGGLAARSNEGTIVNSFAAGLITGPTNDNLAGLVAQTIGTSPIINSYWNIETTGQSTTSGGGTGLVTTEMVLETSFSDWDFAAIWQIVEGESYPFHQWQGAVQDHNYPPPLPPAELIALVVPGIESISLEWNAPSIGTPLSYNIYRGDGDDFAVIANVETDTQYLDDDVEFMISYNYYVTALYTEGESAPSNTVVAAAYSGFAGGEGTFDDPYLVMTAEHLFNVRYEMDRHYQQIAEIDLAAEDGPWTGPAGFQPIGKGYNIPEYAFSGTYDGNGYTISNLFISQGTSTVGLFGFAIGATFKNIGLVDVDITGGMDTGSLAGYAISGTTVFNCYSTGILSAGSHGGGLIGRFEGGSTLYNCYSNVDVTVVGSNAGGLVGSLYNNGAAVSNSYATGNVTSTSAWGGTAGGLVGATGGSAVIDNTFATGNVSASDSVGGLVGEHTQGSTIWNSYSKGAVSGDFDAGGLIGALAYNPGPVANSYWNTETSGQAASQGGEGRTTAEMTYPYAANTYQNWNFDIIWVEDIEGDVNNGYPFFTWMLAAPPEPEVPLVSIQISDDEAIISWEMIPQVDGYRVYSANFPETNYWILITTITDNTVTSYIDDTVSQKFYRVTSFIGDNESEQSEVVGYFRSDTTTGWNMISLAMESGISMASDLGTLYSGLIDQIAYWNPSLQAFQTATLVDGNWEDDFETETGYVLMINALTPFDYYSSGYVPQEYPVYHIVVGINPVMVPLERPEINMASHVAGDIGGYIIKQISYWHSEEQVFHSAARIDTYWEADFPVTIAWPLLIYSNQEFYWPDPDRDKGRIINNLSPNENFNKE